MQVSDKFLAIVGEGAGAVVRAFMDTEALVRVCVF